MKKMILLLLTLTFTVFLMACNASPEETGDSPVNDMSAGETDAPIGAIPEETSTEPLEESTTDATDVMETDTETEALDFEDDGKVYIADAAIYRGTVTSLEEDGTFTLTQADGTDFGADTMTFLTTDSTTGMTEIIEGNYLEVFYGRPMKDIFDYAKTHDAIGINDLGLADMVNFNGKITSIQRENDTVTSITLVDSIHEQETVFNVSEETQVYLTIEDLKEGDSLNIYHKGMMTRSLPPQGIPLEIRLMSETEE